VAEDTRRDTISNNDVWNMSVKGYWMSSYRFDRLYAYAMKGDMELMLAKVRSPTGMFYITPYFIPDYRFDLHISVCVG
jgi:hypothetical protein